MSSPPSRPSAAAAAAAAHRASLKGRTSPPPAAGAGASSSNPPRLPNAKVTQTTRTVVGTKVEDPIIILNPDRAEGDVAVDRKLSPIEEDPAAAKEKLVNSARARASPRRRCMATFCVVAMLILVLVLSLVVAAMVSSSSSSSADADPISSTDAATNSSRATITPTTAPVPPETTTTAAPTPVTTMATTTSVPTETVSKDEDEGKVERPTASPKAFPAPSPAPTTPAPQPLAVEETESPTSSQPTIPQDDEEPLLEPPTSQPSLHPRSAPPSPSPVTLNPSNVPTPLPTLRPSPEPSLRPSSEPSLRPSPEPSLRPSPEPSLRPSSEPSPPFPEPSLRPSPKPSLRPSPEPSSLLPSPVPSSRPTTSEPTTPLLPPSETEIIPVDAPQFVLYATRNRFFLYGTDAVGKEVGVTRIPLDDSLSELAPSFVWRFLPNNDNCPTVESPGCAFRLQSTLYPEVIQDGVWTVNVVRRNCLPGRGNCDCSTNPDDCYNVVELCLASVATQCLVASDPPRIRAVSNTNNRKEAFHLLPPEAYQARRPVLPPMVPLVPGGVKPALGTVPSGPFLLVAARNAHALVHTAGDDPRGASLSLLLDSNDSAALAQQAQWEFVGSPNCSGENFQFCARIRHVATQRDLQIRQVAPGNGDARNFVVDTVPGTVPDGTELLFRVVDETANCVSVQEDRCRPYYRLYFSPARFPFFLTTANERAFFVRRQQFTAWNAIPYDMLTRMQQRFATETP